MRVAWVVGIVMWTTGCGAETIKVSRQLGSLPPLTVSPSAETTSSPPETFAEIIKETAGPVASPTPPSETFPILEASVSPTAGAVSPAPLDVTQVRIAGAAAWKSEVLCEAEAIGSNLILEYRWEQEGTLGFSTISGASDPRWTVATPHARVRCAARAVSGERASGWVLSEAVTPANGIPPGPTAVWLWPESATRAENLHCDITQNDRDTEGDSVVAQRRWRRNGTFLPGQDSETLALSDFAVGDIVSCEGWGDDGKDSSPVVLSREVRVANRAPTAVAGIGPAHPTLATMLSCAATGSADPDGGPLAISHSWIRNGEPAEGATSSSLSLASASVGDSFSCKILVRDSDGAERSAVSETLVVENRPPSTPTASLPTTPAYKTSLLSCTASGSSDPDGDSVGLSYEWTVSGVIKNATTASLAGDAFSKGDQVTCRVHARDARGGEAWSAPSEVVSIQDSPPVLTQVELTSSDDPPLVTSELSCTPASTDVDGDTRSYNYAWRKNGAGLPDQTGATLVLSSVLAQSGDRFQCEVTVSASGLMASRTSNTLIIDNRAPVVTAVSVAAQGGGSATNASTLVCSPSANDPDGGTPTLSYEWRVAGQTLGDAHGNLLAPGPFGNGSAVVCSVTATDGAGASDTRASEPLTITNRAPSAAVALSPANPNRSQALTCDASASSDPDGDTLSFTYKWREGTSVLTGQSQSFLPADTASNGATVTCEVTVTDGHGGSESVVSNGINIQNRSPGAFSAATNGPKAVGEVVTCSGNGTDPDGDALTYGNAWERSTDNASFANIPGETGAEYTPLLVDAHRYLRCVRTANDGHGGARASPSPSFLVANSAPAAPLSVAVSPLSIAKDGTLTCTVTGGGTDPDGDGASLIYVWKKSGMALTGQTNQTLSGTFAHGDSLSCEAAWSDGTLASVFRAASTSALVLNTPPGAPTAVTLSPAVPSTAVNPLTCTASGATDLDGDVLIYEYRFDKNGSLALDWATAGQLGPIGYAHGDVIRCTARAKDTSNAVGSVTQTSVTIVNAPTLTSVSPTGGATAGGFTLTLTGSHFLSGMGVTLGGVACTAVTVSSSTSASCTVPAGSVGTKAVVVTNPQGSATLASAFTVVTPTLQITGPTASSSHTTPAAQISLSGTCTPGLGNFTLAPSDQGTFTDTDCRDGTWSATVDADFANTLITVAAKDAANGVQSDVITLTRSVVLGQSDATSQRQNRLIAGRVWTNGSNKFGVADLSRNRVLLWNSVPLNDGVSPNVVLGASGWDELPTASCGAQHLSAPSGLFYDGAHLIVSDRNNNRVLIWNSWPTSTNQAPDVVLGQADASSCVANRGGAVAGNTLNGPLGVWSDGTRLLVADYGNHRVLYWPTFPVSNGQSATWAIGQSGLTGAAAAVTQTGLYGPTDVASDGTRIFVTQWAAARVTVYSSFPTSHAPPASFVLGQPDFTSSTPRNGGVSARALNASHAVSYGNNLLAVAVPNDHRVLIWDLAAGLSDFKAATYVLGQPSFTSITPNAPGGSPSASNLMAPDHLFFGGNKLYVNEANGRVLVFDASAPSSGMSAERVYGRKGFTEGRRILGPSTALSTLEQALRVGNKLVVSDLNQHRVLIWNDVSRIVPGRPDVVLGQPDDVQTAANNGGLSAKSLKLPVGLASDGSKLFVADYGNHRILVWNTIPNASFTAADNVLGQPDFVTATPNCLQNGLNIPHGIFAYGSTLFVTDHGNHRVLVWDNVGTITNGMAATRVIGQSNFTSCAASIANMNTPAALTYNGSKLAVSDFANNRVLIWNGIPASGTVTPNYILGQPDFSSAAAPNPPSSTSLNHPHGVASDATRLYVSDCYNNRILTFLWNGLTTNAAAEMVLGHVNFTTATNEGVPNPYLLSLSGTRLYAASGTQALWWETLPAENGTPPHGTMANTVTDNVWGRPPLAGIDASSFVPGSGTFIGGKLAVADTTNNRVLIWNQIPTIHGAPADVVLGQDSFSSSEPNKGGLSARSLFSPQHVSSDGTRLIVSDSGNGRVLIWNTVPLSSFAPADVVVCKPDFVTNAPLGGPSDRQCGATSATTDGTRLFVTSWSDNRLLVFNSIPTTSGAAASFVVGQPTLTASRVNQGGAYGAATMRWPTIPESDGAHLVGVEYGARARIWNAIPTANNTPADVILGQPDFTTNDWNSGGLSARSLNDVGAPLFAGGALYLSDRSNHRVLKWNSVPVASFAAADGVWGQGNFTTNTEASIDLAHQFFPNALAFDATSGAFLIASDNWQRVLLLPRP